MYAGIFIEPGNEVGRVIKDGCEALNMNLDELSAAAKSKDWSFSPNHIRKIIRGDIVPSKWLVEYLADLLKLPLREFQIIVYKDDIRRKYGAEMVEALQISPETLELDLLFSRLNTAQKQEIIHRAEEMADGNLKTRRKFASA